MAVILCFLEFSIVFRVVGAPQTDPTDAEKHSTKGMELVRSGDLVTAEQEVRLAVGLQPNRARYQAELGSVLALQGKLHESTAYFEKAVSLDPESADFRRELAAVQWQLGRADDAQKNLEFILRAHSDDRMATILLGMVRDTQGNCQEAIRLLNSERMLVIERPEWVLALIHAYYTCHHRSDAEETASVLASNAAKPLWQDAIYAGSLIAMDAGDLNQARALLNAVSNPADPARFEFETANMEYRAGNFAGCIDSLVELEKSVKENEWLETLLAKCYAGMRKYEEASHHAERAIHADPHKFANYESFALMYAANGDFESAMGWATRAVKLFPTESQAWILNGSMEMKTGHFHDAIDSFGQALNLDPASPEAMIGLANAQLLGSRVSEARTSYERGMKAFPDNPRFYIGCAAAMMQSSEDNAKGTADEEQRLLRKAISLDGTSAAAHYLLGQLLLDQAQSKSALAELLIAEKQDPDSSRIHFALERTYRRLGMMQDARREFALFERLKDGEESEMMRGQPNPATE